MQNNELSLRDAFGSAIAELGEKYSDFVVLDADNAKATRLAQFAEKYPDRFLNVGCAEQNLIGVAAGIAVTGFPVIASTFSVFLCGRAFEQIRNTVCRNHLPIILIGTHSGITVGKDGSSHSSVEDIALMRALPEMTVVVASCNEQAFGLMEAAFLKRSPVYIRVSRTSTSFCSEGNVEIGGGRRVAEGNDVSIFSCGITVERAVVAARELNSLGYSVDLVDLYSVKPLNETLIIDSLRKTGAAVVVEEHNRAGGLGEASMAVSSTQCPVPFEHLCLPESFGRSGEPNELLDYYGLDTAHIVKAAKRAMKQKWHRQ